MKILLGNGRKYLVKDPSKDYHCQYGFVRKEDLEKKSGTLLKTNTGEELTLLDASFLDQFERIRRGPQTIPHKDIAVILMSAGVNRNSVVVDAGAGSGSLACYLGHVCKKVTTYDIREDFIAITEKNVQMLGLKNVIIKKGNIYEPIAEKNIDLMTLDVPEPWKAFQTAYRALKVGGHLIAYTPTTTQAADFVNTAEKSWFSHIKTIELIEREWEILDRKVRPKSIGIGHSGFISVQRKIK